MNPITLSLYTFCDIIPVVVKQFQSKSASTLQISVDVIFSVFKTDVCTSFNVRAIIYFKS